LTRAVGRKGYKELASFLRGFCASLSGRHKTGHLWTGQNTPTDLAVYALAPENFIVPNVCHDGHEGVSPCDHTEPEDNTLRADTWLKQNVPLITQSQEYKQGER
jgi:hypothetical protein